MFYRISRDFSNAFLWLLGSILLVGLTACSSVPGDSGDFVDGKDAKQAAEAIRAAVLKSPAADFISQGKLSLRPQGDAKDSGKIKGFSANYRWQQTGDGYDLELWGALGQGRTRITGSAGQIKIVDGTGRVVKSRNPERLLRRHLGWSLPLAVLPYWLQGEGAPAPPAKLMRFQANADLKSMEQLGWDLSFDRYKTITGATRQERLPGRVRASSPELKLTVVSRDWTL